MMAAQREKEGNELMFRPCMHAEAIILVGQFPVASVQDDFEDRVAERACERGKLLVGRIEEFFSVKR